jgi:hypothetical protein
MKHRPALRHFRPVFPADPWRFPGGRVGCGRVIPGTDAETEISRKRADVTCRSCKRSLWFRQPFAFETAP